MTNSPAKKRSKPSPVATANTSSESENNKSPTSNHKSVGTPATAGSSLDQSSIIDEFASASIGTGNDETSGTSETDETNSKPPRTPSVKGSAGGFAGSSAGSSAGKYSNSSPHFLSPASKIDETEFKCMFDHTMVDSCSVGDEESEIVRCKSENELKEEVLAWIEELGMIQNMTTDVNKEGTQKTIFNRCVSEIRKVRNGRVQYKREDQQIYKENTEGEEKTDQKIENPPRKIPKNLKLQQYPEDPRGGFITSASRQDIVFMNHETFILFQGELKNGPGYKIQDGIRQCAGYLWHQLWWFRTVQGLAVEKAYGFVICGPECKDTDKRKVISLLELSPASKIGAQFKLEERRCVTLNSLKAFWQQKHNNPFEAPMIPVTMLCPGCMMMPNYLLKEKEQSENRIWTIITSGTANLVLRLDISNPAEVSKFIDDHLVELGEEQKQRDEFVEFIKQAKKDDTNTIYFKVKNAACGHDWNKRDIDLAQNSYNKKMFLEDPTLQEWGECFGSISEPKYVSIVTPAESYIFCTYDMGEHLQNQLDYEGFCIAYLKLIRNTLAIEKKLELVHGDIHSRNLVCCQKSSKLHLIDWDEATFRKPKQRDTRNNSQKERYPDQFLDSEGQLYTKVQLFVLFREILKDLYRKRLAFVDTEDQGKQLNCEDANTFVGEKIISLLGVNEEGVEQLFGALETFLEKKSNAGVEERSS
jgi:hypothetical protein